jgi:hypothetical protein
MIRQSADFDMERCVPFYAGAVVVHGAYNFVMATAGAFDWIRF